MSASRRSQVVYASNFDMNCREYYRFQRAQGGAVAVRAKASFILINILFISFVTGMGLITISPVADGTILLVVGGVFLIISLLTGLLLVGLFSHDYRKFKINYWNARNEQLRANATNPNQPTTYPIHLTTNPVLPSAGLYQSPTYPPQTAAYPPQTAVYPPQTTAYPPQTTAYPPQPAAYQAGPQPTAAPSSLPPSYAEATVPTPTHQEPAHEFGYPPAGALPEKGTLPTEDAAPNAQDGQQPSALSPI